MMLTERDALKKAAEKAIELFGPDVKNGGFGVDWGFSDGFCRVGFGKLDGASRQGVNDGDGIVIDETTPWKSYTEILVNMENGDISVRTREHVTIFDEAPLVSSLKKQ